MKLLERELKILKFELWQCQDIKQAEKLSLKAVELQKRIKALENVLMQYH